MEINLNAEFFISCGANQKYLAQNHVRCLLGQRINKAINLNGSY